MTTDGTSRMPYITSKGQLSDKWHDHYDRIADSRGHVSGPFGVLMNSPEVATRIADVGTYVRFEGTLPGPIRELAIITTARELECAYEWAIHEPLARDGGVSEETIDIVADRAPTDPLPGAEALVVRYGRALFRKNEVPESLFRSTKARFGVEGITELTATFGYYNMLACVLNAFEVVPGEDLGGW
ncbi:carboxymuconolactone decarboxylase family protein [Natrinema gelatinilyticum]|uniref:carboxymuconolactone decarboxylase family protein n=1 Tax=Natrinema gelatinilyticum TaxID=2961571 RepID=UPI0020C4D7AA|nr:carboxymuconolactone decarboxylase family protein [Natrinema gelatinilyticum]